MKKIALVLVVMCVLSGCTKASNIDELISAYQLPEYGEKVDIQVTDNEAHQGEVIEIE